MEYKFITGFKGSKLVFAQNNLFNFKCTRPNGNVEYICYQSILSKKTNNASKQNIVQNCSARVIIKPDKTIYRNKIPHTNHNNHEAIVSDLESIDDMEKVCTFIRENMPLSAHKVSPKDIFSQVMAK